jgi:hypothetical protein
MATLPPVSDLYAGLTAKEAAVQHEEFTTALNKANSAPKSAANLMGIAPSAPTSPSAAIAGILADESLTKSMSADVLSSLNSALETQQMIQKDITVPNNSGLSNGSPIGTGLVAFDLAAPAKLIFPKMTPLRNKLARKSGFGTSHRQKVINAISGSETGVLDTWAGITDSSSETFGASTFNRGKKIGYAGYDRQFNYKQFSLSDNVPFSAQFEGQGYQDIRQLAQTTTLYAAMLFEEKALLMSRGTDTGMIGAITAPTIASATARTKVAGEVGLTAGTYYFKTAADAGQFGASAVSSATSGIVVTAGQVVDVVINDVAGALGYEIFAGTVNANASLYYQGRTGYNTFVFGGAADYSTTGAAATTVASDTSAYATGYDGIFAQIIGASGQPSGQVSRINSAFSTTNAGAEYQNLFASLYTSVKADPDEILINGSDRKQLSDAIKGSGTVGAYRLNISQDEASGVIAGDVVTGLHNEITGKPVALTVHPWMPQGNSAVLSYTLPIPDSNVSEVWAVHTVQDFMAVEWPVIDFNYSNSVYFNETLVGSAPQFNGLLQGIKAV